MDTFTNQKTTMIIIIIIVIIIALGLVFLSYQQGYKSGINTKQEISAKYNDNPVDNSNEPNLDNFDDAPAYEMDEYDNALLEKYKHLNEQEF